MHRYDHYIELEHTYHRPPVQAAQIWERRLISMGHSDALGITESVKKGLYSGVLSEHDGDDWASRWELEQLGDGSWHARYLKRDSSDIPSIEDVESDHLEGHTSLHRGYISRTTRGIVVPYNGRYGVGYTILRPHPHSTEYHLATYYTNKKEIR